MFYNQNAPPEAQKPNNVLSELFSASRGLAAIFRSSPEQKQRAMDLRSNPATYLDEIAFLVKVALVVASLVVIGANSFFIRGSYTDSLGDGWSWGTAIGFAALIEVIKVSLGLAGCVFLAFGWAFQSWKYLIPCALMLLASAYAFRKDMQISTDGMREFTIEQYLKKHPAERKDLAELAAAAGEASGIGTTQRVIEEGLKSKGRDATGKIVTSERGLRAAERAGRNLSTQLETQRELIKAAQADYEAKKAEIQAAAEGKAAWTSNFGGLGQYAQMFLIVILAFCFAGLSGINQAEAQDDSPTQVVVQGRNPQVRVNGQQVHQNHLRRVGYNFVDDNGHVVPQNPHKGTPLKGVINPPLKPPTLDEWIAGLDATAGQFLRENRPIVGLLFQRAAQIGQLMTEKGLTGEEAAQVVAEQYRITRIAQATNRSEAHVRNVLRCLQNSKMPEKITLEGEAAAA
ncbi:MAG: hypothetical protein ACK4Q5_16585 [Saprospiraceae bacterium]